MEIKLKYGVPLELIEIIHRKDLGGCGHTAFFYDRRPHQGEIASYLHAYNLDGTSLSVDRAKKRSLL
jgi:hypothetical protein